MSNILYTITDCNKFIYITEIDRKSVSSFLIQKDKIVKIDFDTKIDLDSDAPLKYIINFYIEPYTNCLSILFQSEEQRNEYKDLIISILSK